MAETSIIPDAVITSAKANTSLVPRETLKKQKTIDKQQLQVCALNQPLRWAYGLNRLGAMLLKPVAAGSLYLPFVIARGPINSVVKIEMADDTLPGGVHSIAYYGAAGQGIDPTLQSVWAAKGKTYADTLPGTAWGWVSLPTRQDITIGNIAITFEGLKVYDPRDVAQTLGDASTYVYSANAALCLADFIVNTQYGRGDAFDWDASTDAFDRCDELVGGKPRREVHTCFDSYTDLDDAEEILRTYAGCWVVREGGVAHLVADAPASVVYSFTPANVIADSIKIRQAARKNTPTVVTAVWTDTSVTPWKPQETEPVKAPGVDELTTEWREERIQLPACHDAGQALREALRRLNEYIASDLTVDFTGVDDSIQLQIGDVVNLTDGGGFTAKPFRVIGCPATALGRYANTVKEYDEVIYSDAVASGPTNADTTLPSPASPPMVTGLTVVEDVYQLQTGLYASRLVIDWDDMSSVFPFVAGYSLTVTQAGRAAVGPQTVPPNSSGLTTPPLEENLLYTVSVQVLSTADTLGPVATISITNNGKQARPSDVGSVTGFEVAGDVFLQIVPATDRDLYAHEYRYGPVGVAWESATLLDRVAMPSVRFMTTKVVDAGTYDFLVKGLDSVRTNPAFPNGQESVNAVRCTITVTSDAQSFVAGDFTFTNATLYNMSSAGDPSP